MSVSSVSIDVDGTYSEDVLSTGVSEDDDRSGTKGMARFGSFTERFLLEMGGVVVGLVSLDAVLINFEGP